MPRLQSTCLCILSLMLSVSRGLLKKRVFNHRHSFSFFLTPPRLEVVVWGVRQAEKHGNGPPAPYTSTSGVIDKTT